MRMHVPQQAPYSRRASRRQSPVSLHVFPVAGTDAASDGFERRDRVDRLLFRAARPVLRTQRNGASETLCLGEKAVAARELDRFADRRGRYATTQMNFGRSGIGWAIQEGRLE